MAYIPKSKPNANPRKRRAAGPPPKPTFGTTYAPVEPKEYLLTLIGAFAVPWDELPNLNFQTAQTFRKRFLVRWHPDKHRNNARATAGMKTFLHTWEATNNGTWWLHMDEHLIRPSNQFKSLAAEYVDQWNRWRVAFLDEDGKYKTAAQIQAEEKERKARAKRMEELAEANRIKYIALKRLASKERKARVKVERKAALDKRNAPWNALSTTALVEVKMAKINAKNIAKKARKRISKIYKTKVPLPFRAPAPAK